MIPVPSINRLTTRWAATLADEPTVASALCVWPLLALLADAAEGPAREELAAACGTDPSSGTSDGLAVIDWLAATDGLSAALGIWHRADLPLKESWRSRFPAGVVEPLSGDAAADQAALDAWASSHTAERIQRMPVSVDASVMLLLASALTVDTQWLEPFTAHGDRLWRQTHDPSIVRVGPGLTCVRVSGRNGIDVHLALGVPSASASAVLGAALSVLDGRTETAPGAELPLGLSGPGVKVDMVDSPDRSPRVELETRAFTVRGRHDLLADPAVFGLGAITDRSRGHTPAISDFPLCVGAAAQEAMAEFSAEGFRAAAVTSMMMMAGMARPMTSHQVRRVRVTIDRPFGFVATHGETGVVLVAGWVVPD